MAAVQPGPRHGDRTGPGSPADVAAGMAGSTPQRPAAAAECKRRSHCQVTLSRPTKRTLRSATAHHGQHAARRIASQCLAGIRELAVGEVIHVQVVVNIQC